MKANGVFLSDVAREYPDYLRDESRRQGRAETISFPRDEDELRDHLRRAWRAGARVTVQGARTGITAGAVPDGGHVLNLSRMNRCLGLRHDERTGDFLLRVQPGVRLTELDEALRRKAFDTAGWSPQDQAALRDFQRQGPFFFPPDPTERTASIGGMTACNASGARSFRYGPTRCHVQGLRVCLADGDALSLTRGGVRAQGRQFAVETDGGRRIAGTLPAYRMPSVKNAAGYYAADDMELLDVFIGSEGTLGVFAAVDLRLLPAPAAVWGVMTFLKDEAAALDFVEALRRSDPRPAALEFFDRGALNLLRRCRATNPAFQPLPALPAQDGPAVYAEYVGAGEAEVEAAVERLSQALAALGGDPDAAWLAADAAELTRLKDVRHAVPEAVNLVIDERRRAEPALTKLGTDLAVPDAHLREMLARYHDDLNRAGLEHVIFGHIGDNHLHVNILPRNLEEYGRGRALYLQWAQRAAALGGSVAAEHGIGKLKTELLRVMYGEEGLAQMRTVKRLFDPEWRLNPGNIFPA